MTKDELEIKLFEMINNSRMIINRRNFRTLYLVDDDKQFIRIQKLKKLNDSNYIIDYTRNFSECDCFISIYNTRNYIQFKSNEEIYNCLKLVFNDSYSDIQLFLKYFFLNYYNINFYNKRMFFQCFRKNESHLDEVKFTQDYEYKNPSENKTLAFSFEKYKFDICNFSYKKIVNLFKKK